jgi:outer membrane protein TolC
LIDLLHKDQLVWNFVGNLVKPLFNNGKLKATVARNESQAEEARANYESRLLQSYHEVELALAAEDVLMRREQALQEAVLQSSAARALAEQRYQAGLTGIITVLAAQRTAYNVESQLLGIKRARLDNRVDLHLALGGGFNMGDIPTEIEVRRILRAGEGEKQ